MAKKKKDKRSALQKIGGHTLFPYALKAAGFDEVATKMGYPEHFSESVEDDAKKVVKKAGGGKVCRGMGAATQGGKFRIS